MNAEETTLLKRTFGILLLVVVLIVLGLATWFFWEFQLQSNSDNYTWSDFYKDVFPEFFGILSTALLIFLLLFLLKRSERISDIFLNNFGWSKTSPNTSANNKSLDDSLKRLDILSTKLTSISTFNSSLDKLNEHSLYWLKWRDDLVSENHIYSDALNNAWKELIHSHLDIENDYLKEKKIKNTSESFTVLLSNITKSLYEEFIEGTENAKLNRYHITGMLPEEFFNGPQIEYITISSTPVIFSHAFENEKYSDSHYSFRKQAESFPKMDVKRCIVVQQHSPYLDSRYNALSHFEVLKKQKDLFIRVGDRSYPLSSLLSSRRSKVSNGEAERLLFHCMQRVTQHFGRKKSGNYDFLKSIVGYDQFRYYSIIDKKHVLSGDHYVPLLTYFSSFFSRTEDDTYFYTVRDNISDSFQVYFEPGYMPEIVLFGLDTDGDGKNNKWLLGLQGQYKQFTREIEIEILKPYHATLCANQLIPTMFIHKLKDLEQ